MKTNIYNFLDYPILPSLQSRAWELLAELVRRKSEPVFSSELESNGLDLPEALNLIRLLSFLKWPIKLEILGLNDFGLRLKATDDLINWFIESSQKEKPRKKLPLFAGKEVIR